MHSHEWYGWLGLKVGASCVHHCLLARAHWQTKFRRLQLCVSSTHKQMCNQTRAMISDAEFVRKIFPPSTILDAALRLQRQKNRIGWYPGLLFGSVAKNFEIFVANLFGHVYKEAAAK